MKKRWLSSVAAPWPLGALGATKTFHHWNVTPQLRRRPPPPRWAWMGFHGLTDVSFKLTIAHHYAHGPQLHARRRPVGLAAAPWHGRRR